MRARLITLFILLLTALPAHAQEVDLQTRLVRASADIRAIERHLQSLDSNLQTLTARHAGLERDYTARREKMAVTLAALTRMGRTPREAVLIRPGGPLQAARTSMLLSASIPAIETEAAALRALLDELETTRTDLADKTAQAREARAGLSSRHAALSALMARREQTGLLPDAGEERAVAALAREARTLRDLLSGLGGGAGDQLALVPEGDGQLPVSGIIRTGYGQQDAVGARSSGLSIETLPGSVVVAPLGGIVRYAGPFKGYGNIVIIAHKGGFHSLVAHLDKISVQAGQKIVSGEPIAILDADTTPTNQPGQAGRKTVYYELRQGGTPVNPSRKLPDLG